jgi:hypothetical protein
VPEFRVVPGWRGAASAARLALRLPARHGWPRRSASRYCYLLDEHGDGYMGKGVLKYDLLDEREVAYLDYGGMYGGEALFA